MCKAFFHRDSRQQFKVDHSDELWRLLVTITVRKARGIWRRSSSAGRTCAREQSLDDFELSTVFSAHPCVVGWLIFADELENLLSGLGPEPARALALRPGGLNPTDAPLEMGISRQALCRLLEPLRAAFLQRDSDCSVMAAPAQNRQRSPCVKEDPLS